MKKRTPSDREDDNQAKHAAVNGKEIQRVLAQIGNQPADGDIA